mgnify:FL=1
MYIESKVKIYLFFLKEIERINEMYITSKEIFNKMTENVLCEYLVIHDTMAIFNKC